MPTYLYECEECGEPFEVFQQMSDNTFEKCPKNNCNGKVKRIITGGTGFLLKGYGWFSKPSSPDKKEKK